MTPRKVKLAPNPDAPVYQMTEEDAVYVQTMLEHKARVWYNRRGRWGDVNDFRDMGIQALIEVLPKAKNQSHFRGLWTLRADARMADTIKLYRRWLAMRGDPDGSGPERVHEELVTLDHPIMPRSRDPWMMRRIEGLWRRLRARERHAMICCWIDGIPVRTAAQELGWSQAGVGRCLQRLRPRFLQAIRSTRVT